MKRLLALALPALLAAACEAQAPDAPVAAVPAGMVYLGTGDGAIAVVDAASGRLARTLPAGTPAPDWARIYAAGGGAVRTLDGATGAVLGAHPAPAWADTVRTSADGRWLALASAARGSSSRFQVQDAAFALPPVTVELRGSFTFDALSSDGRRLYLLEWIGPGSYHVRRYDLAAGRLFPDVIAEKGEAPGSAMSGEAVDSLSTSDGSAQLTLYQRGAKGQAFVHVLPVAEDQPPFAWCVDLPPPAEGWLLVPGPDGGRFYAANPAAGWVVELVPAVGFAPPAVRQVRIPAAGGPPAAAAAVSADGKKLYVGGGAGLLAVDTSTFSVRARALPEHTITGLAVAPGGSTIYALSGRSRLLRLEPRALAPVHETPLTAPFISVLRVT